MATDIIARGMITEYKSGTNINFAENDDGSVTISASGSISSEDSVARDAINNHKSDTSNPHNVTPAQIGLGNVDNTSDLDKPISTAVQKAIDNKADKTVATTTADGLMSAEDKTKLDEVDDKYALKSKYGDTTINVGRKDGTTVGRWSTAEGHYTTASGDYSHAEGASTTASDSCSHAEGHLCTASSDNSHAEGNNTTASGAHSHSEGDSTTASGIGSHSGGASSTASGDYSFSHGMHVESNNSCEVSLGKFNKSSSDTRFSIGDGTSDSARHNAFEITTTGGKLHDKDIATTDIIPDLSAYAKKTDVPDIKVNAAVNADTVGEKSADDFAQIIELGWNETDTKTAVGITTKTTIYHCSNWTDFPTESPDGQGILIAANYGGSGTAGTDTMWVIQFFISARTGVVYKRYINGTGVDSWKEISTTPIKSEEFTASTDQWSHIKLFSSSENKKPLAVTFVNTPSMYSVFSHENYYYLELYNNLMQTIPNTSVNFVLYYMEV